MNKFLISIMLLLGLTNLLSAQTTASETSTEKTGLVYELEAGYQVGMSGRSYFFTYNSATNFSLAVGKQIMKDVSLTGSIGIENNNDGTLYPLSANLKKYFGKKQNTYFLGQVGYAWGNGDSDSASFTYHGGLIAGIAYGINLLKIKHTQIYAQLGYKLRRTELEFQAFDTTETFSNKQDNHFLALQFGVQF